MEKTFSVKGMTCEGCEATLEKCLMKQHGILSAKASYAGAKLAVSFDNAKTNEGRIRDAAAASGYELCEEGEGAAQHRKPFDFRSLFYIFTLLSLFALAYLAVSRIAGGAAFPAPGSNTALPVIFAVGLFTGLHCIGMCGGFVASVANSARNGALPLYFSGKLLSYALTGALLGLVGASLIIGNEVRSGLAIAAGLFMVLFGLSGLGIGVFRQIYSPIPKPHLQLPGQFASASPLALGFLNGFMPCGPLQAMQLYALSTGSPAAGGLAMLVFGAGTLPFMAGFGALLTRLAKSSAAILSRASSFVVIFLGISLLWNGWAAFADNAAATQALQDVPSPQNSASAAVAAGAQAATAQNETSQVLRISVAGYGYNPSTLSAKPNTKTRLVVDAKELNGCNRQFQIPAYGIFADLKKGENIFEFTTGAEGTTINFACGMNMLRGKIIVSGSPEAAAKESAAKPNSTGTCGMAKGGSCGGAGCGCGCGGKH